MSWGVPKALVTYHGGRGAEIGGSVVTFSAYDANDVKLCGGCQTTMPVLFAGETGEFSLADLDAHLEGKRHRLAYIVIRID